MLSNQNQIPNQHIIEHFKVHINFFCQDYSL